MNLEILTVHNKINFLNEKDGSILETSLYLYSCPDAAFQQPKGWPMINEIQKRQNAKLYICISHWSTRWLQRDNLNLADIY